MTSFSTAIYQPYFHAADAWVNAAFEIISVVAVWAMWATGVGVVLALVILIGSTRTIGTAPQVETPLCEAPPDEPEDFSVRRAAHAMPLQPPPRSRAEQPDLAHR